MAQRYYVQCHGLGLVPSPFHNNVHRSIKTNLRLQAIVGIDLGTTNSAIACVGPDGPKVIQDSQGNVTTPSIVAITEVPSNHHTSIPLYHILPYLIPFTHHLSQIKHILQHDELLVGHAALSANIDPSYKFTSFKRLLGRKYSTIPPSVISTLPYTIAQGDRGECMIYNAGADDMIAPEELSTYLLQHIRSTAQHALNETIQGAVITVPVHFATEQRSAILDAARCANLGTVHLLQEPVAAAMAYQLFGGTHGETILVLDIGGGTFDVSIVQAFEGIMEVLGSTGDIALGGDNFDGLIAEWITEESSKRFGVGVGKSNALTMAREAKEILSSHDTVLLDVVKYTTTASYQETIHDDKKEVDGKVIELTRKTFEDISRVLFDRMADALDCIGRELFIEWAVDHPQDAVSSSSSSSSLSIIQRDSVEIVEKVEEENTMAPSSLSISSQTVYDKWAPPPRKITQVVLVGQVTLLPSIRSFVMALTGIEPCTSIDPSTVVAVGAALHAGLLLGSVSGVELMDGSFVADLHSRTTGFGEWQP